MILVLKELSMAAPGVKCQCAVEKDCRKARPAPRTVSPPEGHSSQVFVVNTEWGISSPTGGEYKQSHHE